MSGNLARLQALPDTVVVRLDPATARGLANVLAHYKVLVDDTTPAERADGYDDGVFDHLTLQLHRGATTARGLATTPALPDPIEGVVIPPPPTRLYAVPEETP